MKNVIDEVKKYEKEIIKKLDNTGKFFNSTQKYLETYLKKYDSSVGALIKQAKSDYKVLRTSLEKFSKNNNNFSSWNDFLEQTEKKFILKDGETWPNAYPLLSNKFKSDISENYAKLILSPNASANSISAEATKSSGLRSGGGSKIEELSGGISGALRSGGGSKVDESLSSGASSSGSTGGLRIKGSNGKGNLTSGIIVLENGSADTEDVSKKISNNLRESLNIYNTLCQFFGKTYEDYKKNIRALGEIFGIDNQSKNGLSSKLKLFWNMYEAVYEKYAADAGEGDVKSQIVKELYDAEKFNGNANKIIDSDKDDKNKEKALDFISNFIDTLESQNKEFSDIFEISNYQPIDIKEALKWQISKSGKFENFSISYAKNDENSKDVGTIESIEIETSKIWEDYTERNKVAFLRCISEDWWNKFQELGGSETSQDINNSLTDNIFNNNSGTSDAANSMAEGIKDGLNDAANSVVEGVKDSLNNAANGLLSGAKGSASSNPVSDLIPLI